MAAQEPDSTTSSRRLPRRRGLIVLAFGVLLMLGLPAPESMLQPGPALGLSCLPMDVHDQLQDAEVAFIGRPQAEVPGGQEDGPRAYLFDVEVWVKGNLGTPVTVHGFEWSTPEVGQRMAMILSLGAEGVLYQPDCVGTSPETLLAIAALDSEATSDEQPAILIGGEFGAARVMALDGLGRFAGLGAGEGAVVAMAACPTGRRSVEVVSDVMHGVLTTIAVRDTVTLELIREADLPHTEEGFIWPASLFCRDEAGDDVLFSLPGRGIGHLGNSFEVLREGAFTAVAIGRERAVIMEPLPQAGEDGYAIALDVLDLDSGERTPLHRPSRATEPLSFALSPDETHLAFLERMPYGSEHEGMLVQVYDLDSSGQVGSFQLPAPRFCDSCWGDLAWLADGTLLVRDRRWDENTDELIASRRILRLPELEVVEEWAGGLGNVGRVSGELLLTIDHSGGAQRLLAAQMDGTQPVELRVLPTQDAAALLVLHDFDAEGAAALLSEVARPPPPGAVETSPVEPGPSDVSATPPWLLLGLAGLSVLSVLLIAGLFVRRKRAES